MSTYTNKNAVAVNVLRSWLRVTGISHKRSGVSGCDLEVIGKMGLSYQVVVSLRADETAPCEAIMILAKDITGKSKDNAISAFHKVTKGTGWGVPMPFNRGAEPKQKLSYHEDEFLVAVRATETRRSPDPSPDQYKKYDKVMWKSCQTFFNLNGELCRRWGYNTDDLMQHNRVLLINFCARYEKDDGAPFENERLLYTYLGQRLSELREVLLKKERSTFPDADTVSIGLLGKSYGGNMIIGIEYDYDPRADAEDVDLDHKSRNTKLDLSNPTARKASAAKMLQKNLASMSHPDLVDVLTHAQQNILISHDARREAGKQLRLHQASCSDQGCVEAHASDVGVEEDEDSTGIDGLSGQE